MVSSAAHLLRHTGPSPYVPRCRIIHPRHHLNIFFFSPRGVIHLESFIYISRNYQVNKACLCRRMLASSQCCLRYSSTKVLYSYSRQKTHYMRSWCSSGDSQWLCRIYFASRKSGDIYFLLLAVTYKLDRIKFVPACIFFSTALLLDIFLINVLCFDSASTLRMPFTKTISHVKHFSLNAL